MSFSGWVPLGYFSFSGAYCLRRIVTKLLYAVRIVCGSVLKRSSVSPSVCLSVCLSHRSTAAATCGVLLSSGAGCGYRVPAIKRHLSPSSRFPAATRHVGRVNFGPTVRRSNISLLFKCGIADCFGLQCEKCENRNRDSSCFHAKLQRFYTDKLIADGRETDLAKILTLLL